MRCQSVMIAGASNFPVGKKIKQNAARDRNMEEWQYIEGLLDKIRSTGMGGISADDPQAIAKLKDKLEHLQAAQQMMKDINAYYRKHKTLDGCTILAPEEMEKIKSDMAQSWHLEDKPFASYTLTNNNAEISRVKKRIEELEKKALTTFPGWEFDGGTVEANKAENRLQILFDDKPSAEVREQLKSNGFRWSPKANAWQRQLNRNAYYACDYVEAIKPLYGEKP
ncbi:MAG: DNA primase, partial [Clostridia bacterium]|nr:DNA primase [Clostridia bacterium]